VAREVAAIWLFLTTVLLEDCAMSLPLRLGADASEKKSSQMRGGHNSSSFDFNLRRTLEWKDQTILWSVDCWLVDDYLSFYGDKTREFYGQSASYVEKCGQINWACVTQIEYQFLSDCFKMVPVPVKSQKRNFLVYVNHPKLKSFRILKLVKRLTQGCDCSGVLKPASLIETSRQNKRIECQARFSEFISGFFELEDSGLSAPFWDISSFCKIHEIVLIWKPQKV
jgi:hypothetical protein